MVREAYAYGSTTAASDMEMSGGGGDGGVMSNMKPAWLEGLMAETFFGGCGVHENRRKNEKNVFCLHCCLSICPHCLHSHRSHPLLQVLFLLFSPTATADSDAVTHQICSPSPPHCDCAHTIHPSPTPCTQQPCFPQNFCFYPFEFSSFLDQSFFLSLASSLFELSFSVFKLVTLNPWCFWNFFFCWNFLVIRNPVEIFTVEFCLLQ